MLLANQSPTPLVLIGVILLTIALFGGLGLIVLYGFRGFESLARRSLQRRYSGLQVHAEPQPGDVLITYHTYHGFVAWFTQTPHQVALPPDDARTLLGRLLRFNLQWGLVTYGALFIPPLAILNYLGQRRSIARQEANGGYSQAEEIWKDETIE